MERMVKLCGSAILHRRGVEWYEIKRLGKDFRIVGVPSPTTELASVEECSQPERSVGWHFATMRLVRVERCFQRVFKGTSLHGGKLRGGVRTSLGSVLVMNIARQGQALPWREFAPAGLNLAPFDAGSVENC